LVRPGTKAVQRDGETFYAEFGHGDLPGWG
jgi:hypothetical protein